MKNGDEITHITAAATAATHRCSVHRFVRLSILPSTTLQTEVSLVGKYWLSLKKMKFSFEKEMENDCCEIEANMTFGATKRRLRIRDVVMSMC